MSSSEPEFNDAREYSSLEEVMNTLLTAKGKSFRELDQTGRALTGGNKGSLGQIIEESVLKYAINSDAAPDIHIGDTSYELKVTPLKHIKKGKQTSAKERLVIDIINYLTLADETDFESSKMWDKAKNIILVYYYDDRTDKKKELRIDRKVLASYLMKYEADDLATIKNDWHVIRDKVASGHAQRIRYQLFSRMYKRSQFQTTSRGTSTGGREHRNYICQTACIQPENFIHDCNCAEIIESKERNRSLADTARTEP